MKKWIALFLLITFSAYQSIACTTFLLEKNGQLVFGKNYDWVTATGVVHTNLRGQVKRSLPLDNNKVRQWVSKYGSVTFNQYGKEFPNGGMNEAGLVVELMWLTESEYPAEDERSSISVLQWIQYQLDNNATVDEVIATDKILRITSTGTPQHYLVADAKGNAATIEFLNGKMVVHRGKDLPIPVLTNSTYQSSIKQVTKAGAASAAQDFADNSIERFATACSMVQQYKKTNIKKPLVDYSFDVLNKVSQGSFTKWSIVYDISKKQVHFKTKDFQQLKSFDLASLDFACNATPKSFDMNQTKAGNIKSAFVDYSNEKNSSMLKQAFAQSGNRVEVPMVLQNAMVEVASSVRCK